LQPKLFNLRSLLMENEWFTTWFNSPYYHILYKNRDEQEAKQFIDSLLKYLAPQSNANILDLACGKGRYSRYLAEKGFYVTGLDIADESISYARQFENDHLSFFTHDMRVPYRINYFNYIFNFFTSFGYFESRKDHLATIRNIYKGLQPGGIFVLDFFNSEKVIRNLVPQEQKTINQISFNISREVDKYGYILKTIQFEDQGKAYFFTERVRAFTMNDFKELFESAGLEIRQTFGDYQLHAFDPQQSDRLILICQKNG
jgi:SAM-dependent methyltransferase